MRYSRLVGCKFPRLFYMPGVILVIHDGTKAKFLDPIYLYNLTCEDDYVSFAISKTRAKQFNWF